MADHSLDCKQILAQHESWLRRVLYARLSNGRVQDPLVLDEVEEVLQEVAVALVAQCESIQDPDKVEAWLYQVAVRQALMFRRAAGRRRKLQTAFAEKPMPPAETVDPLDWLLQGERRQQVRRALGELSPRDREVLLLKHGENMKYQQIAAITGMSIGAIESRLHRARKKLRARLAPFQFNSGQPRLPDPRNPPIHPTTKL